MKRFLLVLILIFACQSQASVIHDYKIEYVIFTRNDSGLYDGTIASVDCKVYMSADPSIWIVKRIISKNGRQIDQAGYCKFDGISNAKIVKIPLVVPNPGFHARLNTYYYLVIKDYNGTRWSSYNGFGVRFD